jgi:dihydroflavonol-4-reductase
MRALVTGATGLIGAHIVRALVDHGHHVTALVRETSRRDSLAGLPVTYSVADLEQTGADLDRACGECDVVFHTAANFAYGGGFAGLHEIAVTGTNTVLRSCARAGVRRVVVTSSSVVFGHTTQEICIDETTAVVSGIGEPPYVAAKIAQHRLALELGSELNLDVVLACPTMTMGPTSSRLGPSNGIIVAYLSDPFGCTFPGGCNLVSASDVAAGHLLIAEHGIAGESYLLGSQNMAWPAIHTMIAELAGVAPPRVELNLTLAYLAAAAEEASAKLHGRDPLSTREQASMAGRYYWYSHGKAAALGYRPAGARDALIETISWLAASPHVTREMRTQMRLSSDIYRFRNSQ